MSSELINVEEFQLRVWGKNGTPPTKQAIRNMMRREEVPGVKIGRLWYIDWKLYQKLTGDDLVDQVLRA